MTMHGIRMKNTEKSSRSASMAVEMIDCDGLGKKSCPQRNAYVIILADNPRMVKYWIIQTFYICLVMQKLIYALASLRFSITSPKLAQGSLTIGEN